MKLPQSFALENFCNMPRHRKNFHILKQSESSTWFELGMCLELPFYPPDGTEESGKWSNFWAPLDGNRKHVMVVLWLTNPTTANILNYDKQETGWTELWSKPYHLFTYSFCIYWMFMTFQGWYWIERAKESSSSTKNLQFKEADNL